MNSFFISMPPKLSLIQTGRPECSHAIWRPYLALSGWPPPACPHILSSDYSLGTGFYDGASGREACRLLQKQMTQGFLRSCPECIEALKGLKVYLIISEIFSLNRPTGRFSHRVTMSVCLFVCFSVCLSVPSGAVFF